MSSHPTSKARRKRQRLKQKYAGLREDCQLSDIVDTTPEGAVRDERVDTRTQGCQQLPTLIRQALREGWAVPEAAKPKVVAELLSGFFEEGQDPMLRVRLARLLLLLDHTQFERDRAEEAGKGRTQVLNINIVNVDSDAPGAEHTPLPLPSTVEDGTAAQAFRRGVGQAVAGG